jgi:hypothetical protein
VHQICVAVHYHHQIVFPHQKTGDLLVKTHQMKSFHHHMSGEVHHQKTHCVLREHSVQQLANRHQNGQTEDYLMMLYYLNLLRNDGDHD